MAGVIRAVPVSFGRDLDLDRLHSRDFLLVSHDIAARCFAKMQSFLPGGGRLAGRRFGKFPEGPKASAHLRRSSGRRSLARRSSFFSRSLWSGFARKPPQRSPSRISSRPSPSHSTTQGFTRRPQLPGRRLVSSPQPTGLLPISGRAAFSRGARGVPGEARSNRRRRAPRARAGSRAGQELSSLFPLQGRHAVHIPNQGRAVV